MLSSRMKLLAREPLVHFLVLGGSLFLLQGLLRDPAADGERRIEVGRGQIERLAAAWTRQRGREPGARELQELVDGYVREEIFYREALRLGLDRDDIVVRRRLTQKLEFLLQDLEVEDEPSDEELQRFFAENRARYDKPPRVTFSHIFFSSDRRHDARSDAQALLDRLHSPAPSGQPGPDDGDSFWLHTHYAERSRREVAQLFGEGFAEAVFSLAQGLSPGRGAEHWQGPVASAYGYHLVRVVDFLPSRSLDLHEVRKRVVGDWRSARRREANEAAYERLQERYDVVVAPLLPSPGKELRRSVGQASDGGEGE